MESSATKCLEEPARLYCAHHGKHNSVCAKVLLHVPLLQQTPTTHPCCLLYQAHHLRQRAHMLPLFLLAEHNYDYEKYYSNFFYSNHSAQMLRSCGLNVRLVQIDWGEYLREVKESLLIIKTTEWQTEMKRFKSFGFTSVWEYKRETKSSLRLDFW